MAYGRFKRKTSADLYVGRPVGLRTVRVREDGKEETIPAVAFPSVQVLANTWNTERAKEMGAALADECLDRGVDLLLAPGMNIKRHPLNGRNFEYFSEDPELAGRMAKAYVEGVQDGGAGVCIKHFCCNNLEYDRFHQSSEVDEQARCARSITAPLRFRAKQTRYP